MDRATPTTKLLVMLVVLLGWFYPVYAQSDFFHTAIGSPNNGVLQGRQDQIAEHLILPGGELLLASKFNGNHSDVVCAGRSFANLTLLSPVGRQVWSKTYEHLPVDTLFAVPHTSGFHLFTSHRYCHERNGRLSDFEIWNVSSIGELGDRVLLESNASIERWVIMMDRVAVITRSDRKLSLFIIDRDQPGDEDFSRVPLEITELKSFSQTQSELVILGFTANTRMLLLIDKQTLKIRRIRLDFPASHIAENLQDDAIYLISSPRYRNPQMHIGVISKNKFKQVYQGIHSMSVKAAVVDQQHRLHLVGENEDYAAHLIFVEREGISAGIDHAEGGKLRVKESKTFPSVLTNAYLHGIAITADRVVLVGSTFLPGAWGSPDIDGFVVSYNPSNNAALAELAAWDACALDVDHYKQVALDLEQRLLISPRLRLRPKRNYRRLQEQAPAMQFEYGIPVTVPECDFANDLSAVKFFDELARFEYDQDLSSTRGFKIYLTYSAKDSSIKVNPEGTTSTTFSIHDESADQVWDHIRNQVYPYIDQYTSAKKALRRDAGILPEFQPDTTPRTLAQSAQIFEDLFNDWERLTLPSQQAVHSLGAYHRIHLVDALAFRASVNEYYSEIFVPINQYAGAVDKLAHELPKIAEEITVLEAEFWATTGVRISMGQHADHRDYLTALRNLLSDHALLTQIRKGLRGRTMEITALGKNDRFQDIVLDGSRLRLPLAKVSGLPQFISTLGPISKYYDPMGNLSAQQLLGYAIRFNWKSQFERAIKLGASVHDACYGGQSPLHQAAEKGRTEMVKRLIALGAELNQGNANRATPLHLAIYERSLLAAEVLLKAGADPNLLNNKNETVLDIAVQRKHSTPLWLIDQLETTGGKRGTGTIGASHTIPSHGCQNNQGVPRIILQ